MKKQVLVFLILLAALFTYSPSKAQSFTGAELTYDWVADSTFTFTLTLYSRCDSIYTLPSTANICYYNSCNSTNGSIPLSLAAPLPGFINKYVYSANFTIPSKCDYWTFHGTVNRNTTVNLGSGSGIYVEATLNNLDADTSSSPKLLVDPIPYVCINQPAFLLTAPSDPNTDSLVALSLQSRTSAGSIFSSCSAASSLITYIPPYTFQNPFNSPVGYVVDPNTGTAFFTPTGNLSNYLNYAVRVDKYRRSDGKKLGSVMRDAQVRIDSCAAPAPKIDFIPGSFTGSQFSGSMITAKAGTPFSFCFYGSAPPMSNHYISLSDNASQVLPGASVNYTTVTQDSIVGCFSFAPTLSDTGNYTIIIVATDSVASVGPCNIQPIVLKSYHVAFIRIQDPLTINPLGNPESIVIYPNPASATISVRSPIPVNTTLLSLDGKVISQGARDNTIDVSDLCDGMYLLQIRDDTGRIIKVEKIIKTSVK